MAAKPLHPWPPRMRRASPSAAAGFALIEVLVSLLLFSIGVLGMVAMQAKASSYAIDAENRSRAARLANELVATMWAEQTTNPSTLAKWMARVKDPAASGLPNASASLATSTDATTGVSITKVTIGWKAPARKMGDADSQYFTQVVMP
ncbi:type IV pilus modification protein PilV [Rhodoferax sp. OV413]|uniref:type IV pilus modification protein PilV n=1 Tax=Rhodoferax sp. OV413 TaxID=1855285 RepID=UPI002100EA66|nr:type IV pilus modification protein PilV [Rhodoferax sp. OV413]